MTRTSVVGFVGSPRSSTAGGLAVETMSRNLATGSAATGAELLSAE
ncbi:MAG: hypothetical protein ACYC1E_08410 [Propionibacteriaceae bacterium]